MWGDADAADEGRDAAAASDCIRAWELLDHEHPHPESARHCAVAEVSAIYGGHVVTESLCRERGVWNPQKQNGWKPQKQNDAASRRENEGTDSAPVSQHVWDGEPMRDGARIGEPMCPSYKWDPMCPIR